MLLLFFRYLNIDYYRQDSTKRVPPTETDGGCIMDQDVQGKWEREERVRGSGNDVSMIGPLPYKRSKPCTAPVRVQNSDNSGLVIVLTASRAAIRPWRRVTITNGEENSESVARTARIGAVTSAY